MDLHLKIVYNMGTETFKTEGTIRDDARAELIEAFIRAQVGEGADYRRPVKRDVYSIELRLRQDTCFVEDNAGNNALRNFILVKVLEQLVK